MKKFSIVVSIIAVVAAGTYGNTALAQEKDLCGGTGGNGQIVSVGSNEFTIKRNNDGRNQIIYLARQANIETLAGPAPLSFLKEGDRVTLVGGPNRDGSFTADTVVLCSASKSAETPLTEKKENTNFKKVSTTINTLTVALFGLIWLGVLVFLRWKKKKSLAYLLFFTIFYFYLYKVLDYTLLQFQSLLLLQHLVPGLLLNGAEAGKNVNLIPLATLTPEDIKTSLLNILMMMPFGFGLPFITSFRLKQVATAGLITSIVIELLQFITGFAANTTFRVADINDLIFNTLGVVLGYFLFTLFVRLFRRVFRTPTNPIIHHIAARPQIPE